MENNAYIVSNNYGLLTQQVSILNDLYGYPIDNTLDYSAIVKNYQEEEWYIFILSNDVNNILPELQPHITNTIPNDWCGPIYN